MQLIRLYKQVPLPGVGRHSIWRWLPSTTQNRLPAPTIILHHTPGPTILVWMLGCFWAQTNCSVDPASRFSCITATVGPVKPPVMALVPTLGNPNRNHPWSEAGLLRSQLSRRLQCACINEACRWHWGLSGSYLPDKCEYSLPEGAESHGWKSGCCKSVCEVFGNRRTVARAPCMVTRQIVSRGGTQRYSRGLVHLLIAMRTMMPRTLLLAVVLAVMQSSFALDL